MENGKWIQIKASAPVAYLSDVEAVMGMISNSLMTEDYSDIEKDLDGVYGDLIDEELLARDRSTCAVSAFISAVRIAACTSVMRSLLLSRLRMPVSTCAANSCIYPAGSSVEMVYSEPQMDRRYFCTSAIGMTTPFPVYDGCATHALSKFLFFSIIKRDCVKSQAICTIIFIADTGAD